jgi:hypothetical protein
MRLAVMQPYFFPYVGYFSLMKAVDRWVVFDTPQHIRRGWVTRNRVLKNGGDGWKYIHLQTVKCPLETAINEVLIDSSSDWRGALLRNLDYYSSRKAPYYTETVELICKTMDCRSENLSEFLTNMLVLIRDYLEMSVVIDRFSRMDLCFEQPTHPAEWALKISEALGAEIYVNSIGGKDIFDKELYLESGVDLFFLKSNAPKYYQNRQNFVENLSIIDVLMWNSRQKVKEVLDCYELVR